MEGRKDVSPYSHVDKEIVRLQENKNLENTKNIQNPWCRSYHSQTDRVKTDNIMLDIFLKNLYVLI